MIKKGSKVTYHTPYKTELGIVKSKNDTCFFVVFNCAGVWEHYDKYIAECVSVDDTAGDLLIGWYLVDDENNLSFEDWCKAYAHELENSDATHREEMYELYIGR